jgi:ubiquinone/menaquinone biosynthesis C-methylase UbiE
MMRKETITNHNYDIYAPQYSKLWGESWEVTEEKFMNKFLALVKPNSKILDAGCGTGKSLKVLVNGGFDAYGQDISIGMLNEAKKHINASRLQQGDICNLSYPDETFNGVISLFTLHHIEDIKKALGELKRVTKTNGNLYLATHIGGKDKNWETWHSFPGVGGNIYMYYRSEEQIANLLKQNEFEILDKMVTPSKDEVQNLYLILKNK